MASAAYSLDQLKADVKAGTIDTVVAAMVDLQGRLVGAAHQFQQVTDFHDRRPGDAK